MRIQDITYPLTHAANRCLLPLHLTLTGTLNGAQFRHSDLVPVSHDYVRFATWRLCAQKILERGVIGAAAELGVADGVSAAVINEMLPDRPLHLFDTFNGFDDRDVRLEQDAGVHSDVDRTFAGSVSEVQRRLPFAEKAVFHVGWFPETAEGVDGPFCFVSLDADLFGPIYEGLRFFYPRLSPGGFISIHDYNHRAYPGAREATDKWSRETGVPVIPLPDVAGSALIAR
jgi:O-methyltransferase